MTLTATGAVVNPQARIAASPFEFRRSTRQRHSQADRQWPNLAGSGLAALGNRNVEAVIRSCIAL
jgi:hypothetical protein